MGRMHGLSGLSVAISALLACICVSVRLALAQQELGSRLFLSLDCGGTSSTSYSDTSVPDIRWQTDSNFVPGAGKSSGLRDTTTNGLPRQLQSVRSFAKGSKWCYSLPITRSYTYLIRAGFVYGNFDGLQSPTIQFQISVDSTVWDDITVVGSSTQVAYYEIISAPAASGNVSVCLIRTVPQAPTITDPFINTLELREINNLNFYSYSSSFLPERVLLRLGSRVNFGASSTLRYPDDHIDRIWPADADVFPGLGTTAIAAPAGSVIDNTRNISDIIPNAVLSTAASGRQFTYSRQVLPGQRVYTWVYWAEVNGSLSPFDQRVIDRTDNFGDSYAENLSKDYGKFVAGGRGYQDLTLDPVDVYTVNLTRDVLSTLDAIANADELYYILEEQNGTKSDELKALNDLKSRYSLSGWMGDPCQPVPWEGLKCEPDPGSPDLSQVISLDLSGNNLSGPIPADSITALSALQIVNLSNNSFSGTIPPTFASLTSLTTLDLADNQLVGSLAQWMQTLTVLDVSNNLLNGTFPSVLLTLDSNFRYSGNPGLTCLATSNVVCPVLLSPPPAPSKVPPPSTSAPSDDNTSKSSSSIGPIVGAVAGVFVIVVCIVAGVAIWWTRRHRKPQGTAVEGISIHGSSGAGSGAGSGTGCQLGPTKPHGKEAAVLTREAVRIATRNYAQKIQNRENLFYGQFHDQEVAVKIVSPKFGDQYSSQFFRQVELLSTMHHRNLVPLVGYCHDQPNLIILYEYMPGGDLSQRLYGDAASPPLNWQQRLNVACDAAKGLEYLHEGCDPGILHRDVKTSHILLNRNLEAKLTDFGLSKEIEGDNQTVTKVQASAGYLDPEYNSTGIFTDKSDIYSFGVVLMEIICGQPVYAPKGSAQDRYIVSRVHNAIKTGSVNTVVDPALGEDYSRESLWQVAQVAMLCTHANGNSRPSISWVVNELSKALEEDRLYSTSFKAGAFGGSNSPRVGHPHHATFPSTDYSSGTNYSASGHPLSR